MNGLFVTGTDTDAGKTTVAAALLRAVLGLGVPALAVKPVQTGCLEAESGGGMRGEEGTLLKKGCPPPPAPPSSLPRLSFGGEAAHGLSRLEKGSEEVEQGVFCLEEASGEAGQGVSRLEEGEEGRDVSLSEPDEACHSSQRSSIHGQCCASGAACVSSSSSSRSLSLLAPDVACCPPSGARPPRQSLLAPDVACYEAAGGGGLVLETFRPACSPHLAARLAGRPLTVSGLFGKLEAAAPSSSFLVVEGAGGVYVPLNERETMLDFMERLDFPDTARGRQQTRVHQPCPAFAGGAAGAWGCASSAWFLTGPPRKRAAIRVPAPMPTSPMNSACCATTPKPCAISGRSAACPCWPKSLIIPIFFPIQKVRGPVWRRASPRSRKPCGFSSLSVGNRALPGVPPLPVPSRAARTAAPLPGRGWLRDRLSLRHCGKSRGRGQLPPRPSLLLFPCLGTESRCAASLLTRKPWRGEACG